MFKSQIELCVKTRVVKGKYEVQPRKSEEDSSSAKHGRVLP